MIASPILRANEALPWNRPRGMAKLIATAAACIRTNLLIDVWEKGIYLVFTRSTETLLSAAHSSIWMVWIHHTYSTRLKRMVHTTTTLFSHGRRGTWYCTCALHNIPVVLVCPFHHHRSIVSFYLNTINIVYLLWHHTHSRTQYGKFRPSFGLRCTVLQTHTWT